jgi:uridine kinase
MATPKIIIIRGPICAGKTTTINLLKDKFVNASYIDFDAFKRAIDWTQPSPWRTELAFKSALNLAEELMKRNRNILADIHSSKNINIRRIKNWRKNIIMTFIPFFSIPLYTSVCAAI